LIRGKKEIFRPKAKKSCGGAIGCPVKLHEMQKRETERGRSPRERVLKAVRGGEAATASKERKGTGNRARGGGGVSPLKKEGRSIPGKRRPRKEKAKREKRDLEGFSGRKPFVGINSPLLRGGGKRHGGGLKLGSPDLGKATCRAFGWVEKRQTHRKRDRRGGNSLRACGGEKRPSMLTTGNGKGTQGRNCRKEAKRGEKRASRRIP